MRLIILLFFIGHYAHAQSNLLSLRVKQLNGVLQDNLNSVYPTKDLPVEDFYFKPLHIDQAHSYLANEITLDSNSNYMYTEVAALNSPYRTLSILITEWKNEQLINVYGNGDQLRALTAIYSLESGVLDCNIEDVIQRSENEINWSVANIDVENSPLYPIQLNDTELSEQPVSFYAEIGFTRNECVNYKFQALKDVYYSANIRHLFITLTSKSITTGPMEEQGLIGYTPHIQRKVYYSVQDQIVQSNTLVSSKTSTLLEAW